MMAINQNPMDTFRSKITDSTFSCVGAKACMNKMSYTYCIAGRLGTKKSAHIIYDSMGAYLTQKSTFDTPFTSFITFFEKEDIPAVDFEKRLWTQLSLLAKMDDTRSDPMYSTNPNDANFALSLRGDAFFVIGLTPSHPRMCRRFDYPTLVFNPMSQFHDLRKKGLFTRIQRTVRMREEKWHGGINPNLLFENQSDALQYSGLPVSHDWQCPIKLERG